MTASIRGPGPTKKVLVRDSEGHRTYKLTFQVETDDPLDGPAVVLQCPGLPASGSTYSVGNDSDPFAYRLADCTVDSKSGEGETTKLWDVGVVFSTKPPANDKSRCQDTEIKDPLLEPFKVSGSFTKYQEEATHDRFFNPIKNSAHEQIRGPQVEFDKPRSVVKIQMNVPVLNLPLLTAMNNTVNDRPLWGLEARCIKLTVGAWERKFYGFCNVYYSLPLEFDIQYDGFDRLAQDEGSKALNGHMGVKSKGEVEGQYYVDLLNGLPPDPANPLHFTCMKDIKGEKVRVVLNGGGVPAGITVNPSPTVLVPLFTFTNDTNPSISGTIPSPVKLSVHITDPTNRIAQGIVTLTGTDDGDNVITEKIDISDAGTLEYLTQSTFKTLTNVLMGGNNQGVWIADSTGFPINTGTDLQIMVTTASRVTTEGKISIEKYDQSNFLLLGIPLTF